MNAAERRRLTAILGMLGSNSAGERDNAARMAEDFRRQHRLTWDELLGLPPAAPEVIPEPVKPPAPKPAPRTSAPKPKITPRPSPPRPTRAWAARPTGWFERIADTNPVGVFVGIIYAIGAAIVLGGLVLIGR